MIFIVDWHALKKSKQTHIVTYNTIYAYYNICVIYIKDILCVVVFIYFAIKCPGLKDNILISNIGRFLFYKLLSIFIITPIGCPK